MPLIRFHIITVLSLLPFILGVSMAPKALAHAGAMGIVKERMDKFEASEKATKKIKQAVSRGDTLVVVTEAGNLASWASEMAAYFPKNSNQSPSEAKEDVWLRWDDFLVAIQSFEDSASTLVDVASSGDSGAIRQAFKDVTQSCKSCHREFRKD